MALADVNGDKKLDLIAVNRGDKASVYCLATVMAHFSQPSHIRWDKAHGDGCRRLQRGSES